MSFKENSANVETYIAAAKEHAGFGDPDHEVGDLQQMFRLAWSLMPKTAKRKFAEDDDIREIVVDHAEGCFECFAVPGTEAYGTVGDGFDGRCPSCADAHEESGDDDE